MAANPQTSVTTTPARALAGSIADTGELCDIISARVDATAGIKPGLAVLRTEGGDKAAGFPTSFAADDDAILTAYATAAAQQVIDSEANGVIALGRIFPARKITITRSAHVDQDAVSAVLRYLSNGVLQSQTLTFANGGGDTFTSTYDADHFIDLTIPAQAGALGTTKIGVEAATVLTAQDVLGVSVRDASKTLESSLSSDNNELFEDETLMPVLKKGRINVTCETAYRVGDIPYVRLTAAGAEQLGGFRTHDTDSGDALPWTDARFVSSGIAGSVGVLSVIVP